MTSEQFRQSQERIGCKNLTLAGWLGVSPETISRWRVGAKKVPDYAERLMSALETGWRP